MIYLSICIPTYNRREYLKATIESIITQEAFAEGEIELVISDNASEDGTEAMVRSYASTAAALHYYRNAVNEGVNVNIFKALERATGVYRKLSNDTFVFHPGSLATMLRAVKENCNNRPFLIFSNGNIGRGSRVLHLVSADELVQTVSINLTWDVIVGYWEDELLTSVPREDVTNWFWTVRSYLRITVAKRRVVIIDHHLFDVSEVRRKNISYGLIDVFYHEYLKCFEPYKGSGVSRRTIQRERHLLLNKFFLRWFILKQAGADYNFSPRDTLENLRLAYGSVLPIFFLRLHIGVLLRRFKRFIKAKLKVTGLDA